MDLSPGRMLACAIVAAMIGTAAPGRAEDAIITYKSLAPDAAFELARAALDRCRSDGYQVAVVVIDRFDVPLVELRDRFVGLNALRIARGKASTAVTFSRDTSDLVKGIRDGTFDAALARVPEVTPLAGGLVIEAAGSLLGGVGVAGASGGDKDEACAKAGLAAIRDKLDF